jgi:hypothetical protein
MKVTIVNTLEDYLSNLSTLEETDFYRGVGNSDEYKLIPSAGRYGLKVTSNQIQLESDLLERFKRHAPAYMQDNPQNDMEWMFLAQHHGLPTRLLDWTYNPLVALFFAVENEIVADAAVYRCFPFTTQINITEPFNVDGLAWIVPNLNHIRYKQQSGLFTLHSNPAEEDLSKIYEKFIIPKSVRKNIRWKLRKLGITKAFLFSDLDSLSYDIIKTVENKYEDFF